MIMYGYHTNSPEQFDFTTKDNNLYYPQTVNDWLNWIYKLPLIDLDIPIVVCYLKLVLLSKKLGIDLLNSWECNSNVPKSVSKTILDKKKKLKTLI